MRWAVGRFQVLLGASPNMALRMAFFHCHLTKDSEQTTYLTLESCHSLTNATIPLETALFAQHDLLCSVVFAFFFVLVAVGLGSRRDPPFSSKRSSSCRTECPRHCCS